MCGKIFCTAGDPFQPKAPTHSCLALFNLRLWGWAMENSQMLDTFSRTAMTRGKVSGYYRKGLVFVSWQLAPSPEISETFLTFPRYMMLARAPSVGSTQCGAIKVPPGRRDALKKVEIWEENGEVGDCHLVALCGGLLMVTVYTILNLLINAVD